MRLLLTQSLAPTTRATYSSGVKAFLRFTSLYNRLDRAGNPLPATQETLMLFAACLTFNLVPASIKVYLCAVRNFHIEQGFPDPTADAVGLQRLLRGIRRTYGSPRDSRLPITPNLLRRFLRLLNLQFYDHRLIWAAMLLAFFGFLRSSELVGLKVSDAVLQGSAVQLRVQVSKTDPFRQGTTIVLHPSGDQTLCPVNALKHFLAAHPGQGPLFTFANGSQLSKYHLTRLIKALAGRSGIAPDRYSSHSFRIGAATTAAAAGVPDWQIKALGRWLSDAYQAYIRVPNDQLRDIPALLARSMI